MNSLQLKKSINPDDIKVAGQVGECIIARQNLPRVVATKSCKYKAVSLALGEVIIKHNDVLCKISLPTISKALTELQSGQKNQICY